MTFPWTPISQPLNDADNGRHFDVIVVGSGYGGGVAASRLARTDADLSIAVLERGREIAPGEYPRDPKAAMDEFQITLSSTGETLPGNDKRDGLYDLRINDDVCVLVGCGLGGTSLINANVAIEPDARAYDDWPKVFKNGTILTEYYERARKMLGSNPYPAGRELPKLTALKKVADGLKRPEAFGRPDLNVTFNDKFNEAGILQPACTSCGDCVSGCNYGSKNTVLMNYLPDAKARGAEIFTGAEVSAVKPDNTSISAEGKRWKVTARDPNNAAATWELTADTVILAAGTLGTTEILLNSRSDELTFSKQLGHNFSGNGDVWTFGFNANIQNDDKTRQPIFAIGAGQHDVSYGPTPKGGEAYKPGPCITGMIHLSDPRDVKQSMLIEDGVMPGALAAGYAVGLPMLDALKGDVLRFGDTETRADDLRKLGETIEKDPSNMAETVYDGPLSRTMPFLVMAHDQSNGLLEIGENHRIKVTWKDGGLDPAVTRHEKILRKACDVIQAEHLPFPLWMEEFGKRLIAVHPLGGCGMSDSHETGVINDECQVYDADGNLHDGLFVCDGAAIPHAIGVNPHLAITALAEYAVQTLADKKHWTIDLGRTAPPMMTPTPPPPDMEKLFAELLEGIRGIKKAIDASMWEMARYMLSGFWRKLIELRKKAKHIPAKYSVPDLDTFLAILGDEESLKTIVRPILSQVLAILDPIEPLLKEKKFAEILAHLETELGDFSPPLEFPENMVGYAASTGLNDSHTPNFDPYSYAARTKEHVCQLTAVIKARSVRQTLEAIGGKPKITNGKFTFNEKTYDIEDGDFQFLKPVPSDIERWGITYSGKLVADGCPELSFKGFKTLQRRVGSDFWKDITDLRIDIKEGDKLIARGIISVSLEEAIRQMHNLTIEYGFSLYNAFMAAYDKIADTVAEDKHLLVEMAKGQTFRADFTKGVLAVADAALKSLEPKKKVEQLYSAKVPARFGSLILRAYGGLFAYAANYPAIETPETLPLAAGLPEPEIYYPETEPDVFVKLTRFKGGDRGPLIMANGFGTRAMSFATPTVEKNIVQMLVEEDYDVWLFDYRGNGEIEASRRPFYIDDVATKDWPAAIDTIIEITGAKDVQALVHCVGSMTLFMAVLRDDPRIRGRIRNIVASQLGPHPITNWFKFVQSDMAMGEMVANGLPEELLPLLDALDLDDDIKQAAIDGLSEFDPRSPNGIGMSEKLDAFIDLMLWKVPNFAPIQCNNPTCHRINFFFGPSYQHENLNQETHNAISHFFGPLSTTPMLHLSKIFQEGRLVSWVDDFDYLAHGDRFTMPVYFIHGSHNPEMLPEATLRSLKWLKDSNPGQPEGFYDRYVFQGYGHMDTFIGRDASGIIFPHIIKILKERHGGA